MTTDSGTIGPTIYGHRHLGVFFRPVVAVDESGFEYRGARYRWSDVTSVAVHEFANLGAARFRATVTLADGVKIRLNGRALEKHGVKPTVGFVSTRTDAFDELITRFEQHAA
jgi:hypothetical protein